MAKTFIECDNEVKGILEDMLRRFHGQFLEAGVTINCMFVRDVGKDEELRPALKHHGYPALATVKINSLKDRAEGKADATITIDEYGWQEQSGEQKNAIIDHELYHLLLVTDAREGTLKRDDLGRPRLKMRLHDHQLGMFDAVAERHKDHSAEVQALRSLASQSWVQAAFNWG